MKKIKIYKKIQEESFFLNFKIQIGREAMYVSSKTFWFGEQEVTRWLLDTKKFFKGDLAKVTKEEERTIKDFVHFLLVFKEYEYTLSKRRNFNLSIDTLERCTAKEAWEEDGPCPFGDEDYRKEVQLSSVDSQWQSESNLHLTCQFVGHVTNEEGNKPLEAYYLNPINFFHCTLGATPESMKRRLGQVVDPVIIDGNNDLAVTWFVLKILPTYYMLADMR